MSAPRRSASSARDRTPQPETGRSTKGTSDSGPRATGKGRPPSKGARASGRGSGSKDERRARLTGRAAILAVVACAIALSLAYPLREYIAQRREIARLHARQHVAQRQVEQLARKKHRLGDPDYIKAEAQRRLHMCMPKKTCYIVLHGDDADGHRARRQGKHKDPPWYLTLWRSVEGADGKR